METKKCSKCGKNYPATTEYFYKHNTHRDGLRSQCKVCRRPTDKLKNRKYTPSQKEAYRKRKKIYREKYWIRVRVSQWNALYDSTLTEQQLQGLFDLQKAQCVICGSDLNSHCHLDHIIPRCLGGQSEIGNLQFLCEKCNKGKNKWPVEDYIAHCEKVFKFNNKGTQ